MKTRLILFAFLALLIVGLTGVASVLTLASFAPFDPGQGLFPFQNWAEHRYLSLFSTAEGQAQVELQLLERRMADLEGNLGTPREGDALVFVSTEINHVLERFTKVKPENEGEYRVIFRRDLQRVLALLRDAAYLSGSSPEMLSDFQARITTLVAVLESGTVPLAEMAKGVPVSDAGLPAPLSNSLVFQGVPNIDPLYIPFPAGSAGAKHLFFPLDGKHSEIACLSCHTEGNYAGTPNLCTDCHTKNMPTGHYEGQCILCHSTAAWLPSTFDHQTFGAVDCQSCHLAESPANHFPGQCSACHSTEAWLPAAFDHTTTGAFNCQSCHLSKKPANHYPGQCSACHTTSAWKPATFDHRAANAVDCQSCHADRKPANHYSGQCSACHSTTAWKPASFNHQAAGATDCASCHANVKPANHFSGQCSACHSTTAWKPATFNHQAAGVTDCASCHANVKPANHFSGQCSACHSTTAWKPASFNHQAAGATDCQACHSGVKPANHFAGQCSDCHSTSGWKPANFNHSFPINHGDANGVCAKCHPSGGSSWTCFTCHNESELTKKHNEEGIPDFVAQCMECHGDGRKHDD